MSHADVRFLDRVVAEIDATPVPASDVAIARALGLFDLTPAPRAIEATDVERYVDGRLLTREATRLGVETTAEERAEAWAAAADRAGGQTALEAWLRIADVDPAWARRLVDEDLMSRRFVEVRFRDLAFVSEAEVTAAMGPGAHGEADAGSGPRAARGRRRPPATRRMARRDEGAQRHPPPRRRRRASPGPPGRRRGAPLTQGAPLGDVANDAPSRAGDQPAVVADL